MHTQLQNASMYSELPVNDSLSFFHPGKTILYSYIGCSLLFTATHIGQRDLASCLRVLKTSLDGDELPDLKQIVLLKTFGNILEQFQSFDNFLGESSTIPDSTLCEIEQKVQADQTCTFQFTSGTTGAPKIAMLTHKYYSRT